MASFNVEKIRLIDQILEYCTTPGPISLSTPGWIAPVHIRMDKLLGRATGRRLILRFMHYVGAYGVGYDYVGSAEEDACLSMFIASSLNVNWFALGSTGVLGMPPVATSRVLLVDGIVSSGAGMRWVIEYCRELKANISTVLALIDLCPNSNLERYCKDLGIQFSNVLTAEDINVKRAMGPNKQAEQDLPPQLSSAPTAPVIVAL